MEKHIPAKGDTTGGEAGNFHICPVTPACFSEVRALERLGQANSWSDVSLESELTDRNAFHFGAYSIDCRRLLSFILSRIILDEQHIHHVCTHPDFRRRGFARSLLHHALDKAGSRGVKKVFLEVAASNTAALELYARAGFKKDFVREKYYLTGDDALVMSKSTAVQ